MICKVENVGELDGGWIGEKYHAEGWTRMCVLSCRWWWMLGTLNQRRPAVGKRLKRNRKQIEWKPETDGTISARPCLIRSIISAPFLSQPFDWNIGITFDESFGNVLSPLIFHCIFTGDQAAAMSRKNNAQGIFLCGSELTLVHLFSALHLFFTINLTSR